MDKYPVFQEEQAAGELTVTPETFRLLPGAGGAVVRVGGGGDRESPYRCSGTGERLPANPPPVFQTVDRPVGTHPPGRTAPFRRGAGALGTAETGTAEKSIPPLPLGRAFRCADLPAGAVSSPSHGMTRPLFLWKPCFALPVPGVCRDGRTGYFALMTGNGLFFEKT